MLHSVVVLNLDHMRVLLRPSETTITTQNLWQVDCNLGDSSYSGLSEPLKFPTESAFVCEVLPPLSLGNCRFECLFLQDVKQ